MGLQKYNLALFDGIFHEEQLACIEQNGIKRYITGLNEFAPEVKMIKDKDVREARVKAIRLAVKELEQELAANILDENDPQFWNNVKLLRPDNDQFWSRISVRCSNLPVFMDPEKDAYDRIKLYAIEAGGFSIVAKSLEEARKLPVPPKFYLDKVEETISTQTEYKKIRNKALAELDALYNKTPKKLMYVAKVADANSAQYRIKTPPDVLYDNMDKFINGEGVEKNKTRAAQTFLDVAKQDMATLKLRAMIKDASYYKIIAPKSDGFIYHMNSGVMMGRTPADAIEFLKNPMNDQLLDDITKGVEKYWNM